MEVICLEEAAFFELIDQVKEYLGDNQAEPPKWVKHGEAPPSYHTSVNKVFS